MTPFAAPEQVLKDIDAVRRRTRRRLDDNWFTFAALGEALLVSGLASLLLSDAAAAGVLVASLLIAYLAIALRARDGQQLFGQGRSHIPAAPFALSITIAAGAYLLGATLTGDVAIAAVSGWSALGCLVFAAWQRSSYCLALAVLSLVVGAAALLGAGAFATALYGLGFLAVAATAWFVVGRRAR